MGTAIERVKAFRDVLVGVGATEHRMPHTTAEAVTLAQELAPDAIRHPQALAAAITEMVKINELPKPDAGEEGALLEYLKARERGRIAFWDAFEGQSVEGVEIVRRAGK